MHLIDNVLISQQVWETRFACHLDRCLGKCCQYGDLGSPINEDEARIMEKNLDNVAPYLSWQSREFLKDGVSEIYMDSLHIREIGANKPCPLSYQGENEKILCSLHSYAQDKQIPLLKVKPLWCAMFPLMIKKSEEGWIINLCIPEFCVSTRNPPPVLISFADLLVSLFGEKWVAKVKETYKLEGIKI